METPALANDVETLEKLNQGYVDAVQNSDSRWFEEHLTEDFLNTNPDGTLVDRAGFLARVARPAGVKGLQPQEVKIRLMGDFAIIHAKTVYRLADGRAGAGRYTDIWARRQGRWRCVAAHVTRG